MEKLTLKNGAEEDVGTVTSTMMAIERLCEDGLPGFAALYDLVLVCRGHMAGLARASSTVLRAAHLVDDAGTVHSTVRNVVLSSATGEDARLAFGSPVA